MDRALPAGLLRARRGVLQPEDVGLPRGRRRRTGGLRREEVAAPADMSAGCHSRTEQQRGPAPSERMLVALARAWRLKLGGRDRLLVLGGIPAPGRTALDDHIGPTVTRVVARLSHVPAMVMSRFGERLLQTPPAVALLGDFTRCSGLSRCLVHRRAARPRPLPGGGPPTTKQGFRRGHPGHLHSRSHRKGRWDRRGPARHQPRVRGRLAAARGRSDPSPRPQALSPPRTGRTGGPVEMLVDPRQCRTLLVLTAPPGSPSRDRLQMPFGVGPWPQQPPSRPGVPPRHRSALRTARASHLTRLVRSEH